MPLRDYHRGLTAKGVTHTYYFATLISQRLKVTSRNDSYAATARITYASPVSCTGSSAIEYIFPEGSLEAGQYVKVATESSGFSSYFGFAPDFLDQVLSINGDDVVEIFLNGQVVDQFGMI